jgi:hypothetical protein
MDDIEQIVNNIPIEDLENKELCIRCVAANFFELYDPDEMEEGISTSDQICSHCYDNELEAGYKKMNDKKITEVGKAIEKFNKYKEQRLNKEYNL